MSSRSRWVSPWTGASVLGVLLTLVLGGCAHAPQRMRTEASAGYTRPVNPVALHHVFRGALYETLGDPRAALIEYQEALLYDSTASSIYQAIGENYLRLHKFGSAVKMLEKAVRLDSGNTDALRLLADLYQRARAYEAMERVLRTLLRHEPEDPDVLSNLVSLLVSQGRAQEALTLVIQTRSRRPLGVDELLDLAEVFARQGAADQAEILLHQAIEQEPSDERPYMFLADLKIESGDTTGAETFLENVANEHPDFHQVRRRLHDVYLMQGDLGAAIQLLEQEVREDSNDISLWLQLGRLYVQRGDTAEGVRVFREVTRRFPREPSGYVALAAAHLARQDTVGAIQVLREGLAKNFNAELVQRAKDLLVQQGRVEEAIDLMSEWVDRDTANVPAQLQLADLWLTTGDTTRSEAMLEELVRAYPEDWRAHFALGRLYYVRRQWEKAIEHLDRARELEEQFVGTWVLMSLAYLRQDSLAKAAEILQQAVQRFPQEVQVNFLLGNTLSRLGRKEEAVGFLEAARRLSPDDVDILLGLAAVYDELRQYDRSDSIYKIVLEKYPDHPTALNNYAYSLSVRGERLQEAYEMAEKALEADPENGAFLDTMGWILYQMGRYEEALEYIRKASERRADSAEVFEHLGDVYEKLGDLEQARRAWRKALELDSSRQHLTEKLGTP